MVMAGDVVPLGMKPRSFKTSFPGLGLSRTSDLTMV